MSSVYTYPGVYVQELPSPVHSITGVATSITAFVGYTASGIDNRAQAIYSFSDFQRLFGGLASNSEVSYAVQQFYQNGGSQAYVVRTPMHYTDPTLAYAQVVFGPGGGSLLGFYSLSSGQWANSQLLIDIDVQGLDLTADPYSFNLTTTNLANGTTEYFPAVTLNSNLQNYVTSVINDPDNGSQLVNVNTTTTTIPATLVAADALEVTGILGTAIASQSVTVGGVTSNYLTGVNVALGGGATTSVITLVANPANNDTLTINGTAVTFVTGVATGNEVTIAATATLTATALYTMLAASADSNLVKATYTNPSAGVVQATANVGQTITAATSDSAAITFVNNGSTLASADCWLTLTPPVRTSTAITSGTVISVKFLSSGQSIPQTVQGLASQLQQAINQALAIGIPGASVVCSAAPNGTGTMGIRVNALLPNQPDGIITFADPASGLTTATALGLAAPTSSNAAHYALGTGIGLGSLPVQGQEFTSTQAAVPVGLPYSAELIGDPLAFSGIYALLKVPIFNMLSIPEAARALPGSPSSLDPNINPVEIYTNAITLCDQARAMLLIDPPPNVTTVAGAVDWKSSSIGIVDPNGAAFWPRLRIADQLNNGALRTFAPSGLVAGVYANTDGTSGVWKAPAGIGATLNGVQNMTYQMSDAENGVLNPLGLNCFRTFPIYGPVLWGARTLVGADAMANQWKYVPVRRTALFLESSLYQGLQWVVFEPNDEPLWAAIRLNVGSFLQTYFLKGAFQGQTPDQAYFVKCDSETTTQTDINNGVVNILVGFAPLVPAEFVVIQIEQLTGQAGS
jgi:phage tail sheath protein FI